MAEHEKAGGLLTDDLKVAIILRVAPPDLQRHLELNAQQYGDDYAKLHTTVLRCCRTCNQWVSRSGHMEVDAVPAPRLGRDSSGAPSVPRPAGAGGGDTAGLGVKGKGKGESRSNWKSRSQDRWCSRCGEMPLQEGLQVLGGVRS